MKNKKTQTKEETQEKTHDYETTLPKVILQIVKNPTLEPSVAEKFIRIVFRKNLPLVLIGIGVLFLGYFLVNSFVMGFEYNKAHGIVGSDGNTPLDIANPLVFTTGPFVFITLVALIALGVLLNQQWNDKD